ncbi:PREDICTED: protein O-linked-mannose beta-1,4-N-acetylglucosaminyltransferase 2-like [Priapulus caudatus]|uniref:Protein O-linked-mannose beta-1,4-N-acetylglucosaminyltransferase 2-like n=1 Tax=Priapulus caudatus TaxID=37621 RepID=A0ABM1DW80_PRICU|nr:PREDICTED: protein O-linked-mannose beta-1,4-N-acetylglucosaminyltransferase 2-like [Priapulus caudatus]XP_014664193.1 PREDICTED: protein O-linked-mannose beta-1,4-N-acetylglucosaminyltransferase 2-like [Priapulus caudatus]XP_014664201.1 PREDICTED: protein O-linked-mannose beta-1,4-N-acetylglucosaminyltransferase 2-like [Priapulus caudatus]
MPDMNRVLNFALICMMAAMFQQYLTIKGKLDDSKRLRDSSSERESHKTLLESVQMQGSSVWCRWQHDQAVRLCWVHNLCYLPQQNEFVVFRGNKSRYHGVPDDRFSPALQDFSSVRNHGANHFNFAEYPLEAARNFNVQVVPGVTLAFNRFKPDNLMHAIHDDLLPMYETLLVDMQVPDVGAHDVRLAFMEGWDPGEYRQLYEIFSPHRPVYRNELDWNAMVCFEKVHAGLSRATTFYQYGFTEPQGPIEGSTADGCVVRRFAEFVRMRLGIELTAAAPDGEYVVLISRRANRQILNEAEVALAAARTLGARAITVSPETHDVPVMIALVSRAAVVVGVHGALLALAAFMRPAAALVELFPYAVDPAHYAPYRTLAGLPRMRVAYRAWRVASSHDARAHPDAAPERGGIRHLPADEQRRILASESVPRHLCCSDPEWLYRIYQDTHVDIPSFVATLEEAVAERRRMLESGGDGEEGGCDEGGVVLSPGPVRDIECDASTDDARRKLVGITWRAPNNLAYFNVSVAQYEVLVRERGKEDVNAFLLGTENFTFATDETAARQVYYVWVKCIVDKSVAGPFNDRAHECEV